MLKVFLNVIADINCLWNYAWLM